MSTHIGLLSDSHGDARMTQRAVNLLVDQGATMLLHMGDICSFPVIDALLIDPKIPVHMVFGNNDDDWKDMARYAADLGIIVDHPVGRLELDDKKTLVFMHGDDSIAMARAIDQKVTYLIHGHTHRAADQRVAQTRIINPGALYRASTKSVAMLDVLRDDVQFSSLRTDG